MKYYKFIFYLLFLINLFLLYKYLLLNAEYIRLRNGNNKFYSDLFIDSLENQFLKKNTIKNKFYLISFIYENGCIKCNKDEIELLNIFYKNYQENLFINYYGTTKNYLKKLGIIVPINDVNLIEILPEFVDDNLSPTSFLVDFHGRIYDFHRATSGMKYKSENFFKRMNSFFRVLVDK